MKTTVTRFSLAACALILSAAAAFPVKADEAATPVRPEKTYTGMVTSVNTREHVLAVHGWLWTHKSFNLGKDCAYKLVKQNPGDINGLRAGQKVTVAYQDASGVLIADRITQVRLHYEGMIKSKNVQQRTLTLHWSGANKKLVVPEDCEVLLRGGKAGTFNDIKVGDHVTVTYEKPGDTLTARQIAQTSMTFTGTLTAIDLEQRIVKAKTTFESKKFNLTDDCAIVINGKPDGSMADLRPEEKLTFSYDSINGINVANRIAPADNSSTPVADDTTTTTN